MDAHYPLMFPPSLPFYLSPQRLRFYLVSFTTFAQKSSTGKPPNLHHKWEYGELVIIQLHTTYPSPIAIVLGLGFHKTMYVTQ